MLTAKSVNENLGIEALQTVQNNDNVNSYNKISCVPLYLYVSLPRGKLIYKYKMHILAFNMGIRDNF